MDRYSRQQDLVEQEKLSSAHVSIVGVGALGSVAAELLARMGVGTITLIDHDVVLLSNLQRQGLYTEDDLGKHKVDAAKEHLTKINRDIIVQTHATHLHAGNSQLIESDLILDGTDNLHTRLLVDEIAHKENIPWIYCAAVKKEWCVYPTLPWKKQRSFTSMFENHEALESCDAGVLPTTTHMAATMQIMRAIDILMQKEPPATLLRGDGTHVNEFDVKYKHHKIEDGLFPLLSGTIQPVLCKSSNCIKVFTQSTGEYEEVHIAGVHVRRFPSGALELATTDFDLARKIVKEFYTN